MKKLEEKIEKLGGGLESMWLDTQSVNAKVNALSKGKEKDKHKSSEGSHDEGHESHLTRSSRFQRSERVWRHERHRDELLKEKTPPFLGDGGLNAYYYLESYTLIWWNEIAINIRGMRRASIKSWDELKREMRERFVPSFYTKLQRMYQGSKSVEKYFKEILVHQATKVELQLKRHGRRSYPNTSSSWKGKEIREDKPIRDKSPKKGRAPSQGRKEEVSISTPNTSKSSNIECFKCLGKGHITSQCPNKKTMIIGENGEVESEIS
ncbi:hypothetical protein CR513_60905, partial [Mucuna pruriens]